MTVTGVRSNQMFSDFAEHVAGVPQIAPFFGVGKSNMIYDGPGANEDFGLETRVARYHNVYGPYGTYDGGREKAPAAICRKVIEAKLSGKHQIEIWGDGQQTRSFMYVDDCVAGSIMLAESDVREPLNIGSSELVTINDLVSTVEQIADITLERKYKLDAPQGVRGRNSDNTLILERLGWEPSISLRDGLEKTYAWIHDDILARSPVGSPRS